MNLNNLKDAVSTHPSYPSISSEDLRLWLLEDVQQTQRVQLADIYRLALQKGIDEELEDLVDNTNAPTDERKVAKRFLRMLSQTVVPDIDIGHAETQADFALMVGSELMPAFDVGFASSIGALGVTIVKRHQALGVGLPLVREIEAARAL